MPDRDGVVARIDRAVEGWERGPDAMRWSPRAEVSAEQIERARAAARRLDATLGAIVERVDRAVTVMARGIAAAVTAAQADCTLATAPYCFCLHNHKDQFLCQALPRSCGIRQR